MTLALLGFLSLTATPAPTPTAFTYHASDGVDHYVGSEDDIPDAYRKVARRIELSGVPLNSDLAKGWPDTLQKAPAAVGKSTDILARSPYRKEAEDDKSDPTAFAVVAAILLCVFPALLLAWLRAPRRRVPMLAAAVADLALGLGLGLYATHQLRPPDASDLVDLNPLHAIDNARKVRDQVNAKNASEEKAMQQMLGEKAPAKPKGTAPAPKQP